MRSPPGCGVAVGCRRPERSVPSLPRLRVSLYMEYIEAILASVLWQDNISIYCQYLQGLRTNTLSPVPRPDPKRVPPPKQNGGRRRESGPWAGTGGRFTAWVVRLLRRLREPNGGGLAHRGCSARACDRWLGCSNTPPYDTSFQSWTGVRPI